MKLSEFEKSIIQSQCQPLIEKLKTIYVLEYPDKKYNYLADIYIKWYRDNLYFCGKYRSENSDKEFDEFEDSFVRLKIIKPDRFELSYMRHTKKWALVARNLKLNESLEMIEGIPTFHPA